MKKEPIIQLNIGDHPEFKLPRRKVITHVNIGLEHPYVSVGTRIETLQKDGKEIHQEISPTYKEQRTQSEGEANAMPEHLSKFLEAINTPLKAFLKEDEAYQASREEAKA